MVTIIYPNCKKFFIASTVNLYSFGEVLPGQCMESGLNNLEIFDDFSLYTARLSTLGLAPQTI